MGREPHSLGRELRLLAFGRCHGVRSLCLVLWADSARRALFRRRYFVVLLPEGYWLVYLSIPHAVSRYCLPFFSDIGRRGRRQ